MSSWLRVLVIASAVLLVAVVFQSPFVAATGPTTPADTNAALATNGGTISASSSTTGYEASKAIDGSTATSWASSTGTPTLTVTFSNAYYISEIHLHMVGVAQPDIDLYADPDGTGATWNLVKSVRGNGKPGPRRCVGLPRCGTNPGQFPDGRRPHAHLDSHAPILRSGDGRMRILRARAHLDRDPSAPGLRVRGVGYALGPGSGARTPSSRAFRSRSRTTAPTFSSCRWNGHLGPASRRGPS